MHLNDLPNDCLLLLFVRFSLQEQIHLRIVCRHWKVVIESAFHGKKSLKLFGSVKNVRSYISDLVKNGLHNEGDLKLKAIGHDDDLVLNVAYVGTELCDLLLYLFPNIDKLLLCFRIVYPFHQVPYLLQHWQQLISLSLFGLFYPQDDEAVKEIFTSLANCSNLQSLHLVAGNLFAGVDSIHNLPLRSVLSRLNHLSLNNIPGDLVQVLQLVDENCQKLSLNYIDFPADELFSSSLCLANKVKCLQISGLHMNSARQFVDFLVGNFTHLKCLKIDFCRYPLMKFNFALFENLQELSQLSELHLAIKYDQPTELTTPLTTATLLQVKILRLTLLDTYDFNIEFFCCTFSSIFPQLQQLFICHEVSSELHQMSQQVSVFAHLAMYRLYSREDEFDFLGRHVNFAIADDNQLYAESRIRKIKIHKLQMNEKVDLKWQLHLA